MVLRSDSQAVLGFVVFFILFVLFVNFSRSWSNNQKVIIADHVIMAIQNTPKNKKEMKKWDHMIHKTIKALNKECGSHKNKKTSRRYSHKRDDVFLTHSHGEMGSYCFHLPSTLSYNQFINIAYTFYKKRGIQVSFHRDYLIQATDLNRRVIGLEGNCITISEYKSYSQMTLEQIEAQMKVEDDKEIYNRLDEIRQMRPYFDWHLKLPLMGVLENDHEIHQRCQPLSWWFSAWDLAPKQGAGINIAVIDTGSAAFDLPDYSLAQHPNIEDASHLIDFGLNLVSENGLDPSHQLAIQMKPYFDDLSILDIEEQIEDMAIDFLKTKKPTLFEQFILENGTDLQASSTKLNADGEKALEEILYGEYGVKPNHEDGFFTLTKLDGKFVILEGLPSPIIKEDMEFMATHGTFTQGIIHAQPQFEKDITGIAPNANLFPIKALEDDGATTKKCLDHALRKSMLVEADIVNLSLKALETYDESDEDDKLMKSIIDSFPYIIAASGNDGDPSSSNYVGKKMAYPAKFESVAFDVGGFKFDENKYTYGPFSQYEPSIGPKILAPGFNMLTSAVNKETGEMCKMFMGGTSAAVPVVTGALALALGEFKDDFSRETILKVFYYSSVKMNDSLKWQNDVALGMIDLRSSLLCLHVLKEIQDQKHFNMEEKENLLIEAIFYIFYHNPNTISSEFGIPSLKSNFATYRSECFKLNDPRNLDGVLISNSGVSTVSKLVDIVIQILKGEYGDQYQELQDNVHAIYKQLDTSNENLFDFIKDSGMRKRVITTLNFEIDTDSYWHESITNVTEGVVHA